MGVRVQVPLRVQKQNEKQNENDVSHSVFFYSVFQDHVKILWTSQKIKHKFGLI